MSRSLDLPFAGHRIRIYSAYRPHTGLWWLDCVSPAGTVVSSALAESWREAVELADDWKLEAMRAQLRAAASIQIERPAVKS